MLFDGTPLDDVPVESRIKLGMSRTFQHAAVFDKLSCVDNVLIASASMTFGRQACAAFTWRCIRSAPVQNARPQWPLSTQSVSPTVRAMAPADLRSAINGAWRSHGRSSHAPRIILLDEPVSGVSVEEAAGLRELLLRINRELGTGMVVIEHNISFLVSLCNRISA